MLRAVSVSLLCLTALAGSAAAGTLDDIRSSGVVTCGLDPSMPGLSLRDEGLNWSGIYVDLCRAIAAAILADPSRTNLVALARGEGVIALQSGEIDVLLPPEPLRSGVYEKDGLMWVAPVLHEERSDLASYAPVVRQGDDRWFLAVRAVIFELIRSAGTGLTQEVARSRLDPEAGSAKADDSNGLGLVKDWQLKVVAAAGNHAEILGRNIGPGAAAGVNAVWSGGGLHWAPP